MSVFFYFCCGFKCLLAPVLLKKILNDIEQISFGARFLYQLQKLFSPEQIKADERSILCTHMQGEEEGELSVEKLPSLTKITLNQVALIVESFVNVSTKKTTVYFVVKAYAFKALIRFCFVKQLLGLIYEVLTLTVCNILERNESGVTGFFCMHEWLPTILDQYSQCDSSTHR